MKHGAPDRSKQESRNPSAYIDTHSGTYGLLKGYVRDLCRYWQSVLGAPLLSLPLFRSSLPHHWHFIIVWLAIAALIILYLLVILDLYVCVCSTLVYIPASPSSDSFFSPLPPSCSSKQTHFLLTLSLVVVICCACRVEYWATLWPLSTKGRPRKPEGWRICSKCGLSPSHAILAFTHCLACGLHAGFWSQTFVASAGRAATHHLPKLLQ